MDRIWKRNCQGHGDGHSGDLGCVHGSMTQALGLLNLQAPMQVIRNRGEGRDYH